MKIIENQDEITGIQEVAERFRSEGYQVLVEPDIADLPNFARDLGYRPDIIATSPTGSRVVVEVKGRPVNAEMYRHIAESVDSHDGWSFRLVVVPAQRLGRDASGLVDPNVLANESEEVDVLCAGGHLNAAFLLAWRAAEAAMRRLVISEKMLLHSARPSEMMGALLDSGYIEYEQYAKLVDIFAMRNAVAHGYKSPDIKLEDLKFLQTLCRDLLSDQAA